MLDANSALIGFAESFQDFDFEELICGSERIDIMVHYFDSWTRYYQQPFSTFFANGGILRLFLPNLYSAPLLYSVNTLFPKHSGRSLADKIDLTMYRFLEIALRIGAKREQLSVHHSLRQFSYPAIRFDDVLVLSVFQMFKKEGIKSPVFIIDLAKSDKVASFWTDEILGIMAGSYEVDVWPEKPEL